MNDKQRATWGYLVSAVAFSTRQTRPCILEISWKPTSSPISPAGLGLNQHAIADSGKLFCFLDLAADDGIPQNVSGAPPPLMTSIGETSHTAEKGRTKGRSRSASARRSPLHCSSQHQRATKVRERRKWRLSSAHSSFWFMARHHCYRSTHLLQEPLQSLVYMQHTRGDRPSPGH